MGTIHTYIEKHKLKSFIFIALIFMILSSSCKQLVKTVEVPVYHTEYVTLYDTVKTYDSIVVLPTNFIQTFTASIDTLVLQSSQAIATCWLDSSFLVGTIKDTKSISYKYKTLVETVTKDSIVYVDRPVPVETVRTEYVKSPCRSSSVILLLLLFSGLFGIALFLKNGSLHRPK